MASPSPLILADVRVFLHIRDGAGAQSASSLRKQSKHLVAKLGGSLTLSESTANLIIFSEGSDSFLHNMRSAGRVVVRPDYLTACASEGAKLDPREYLIADPLRNSTGATPIAGRAKPRRSSSSAATAEDVKESPAKTRVKKKSSSPIAKPVPATSRRLLDDDEDDGVKIQPPTSVPYLMQHSDDEEERIALTHPLTPTPPISTGRSASRTGAKKCVSSTTSHNRAASTTRVVAKEDPFLADEDSSVVSEDNRHDVSPSLTQSLARTVPVRGRPATKRQRTPQKASRSDACRPSAPSRDAVSHTPNLHHPSDVAALTAITQPASSLRVALLPMWEETSASTTSVDVRDGMEATLLFLADVVVQLGAKLIGDVSALMEEPSRAILFGRKQKPTHVVLVGDGVELSPDILLARALGLPLITSQWLMDAIALGGFPRVEPHLHLHALMKRCTRPTVVAPPNNNNNQENEEVEVEVEEVLGGEDHAPRVSGSMMDGRRSRQIATMSFLRKGVAEEMVPCGEQWQRPFYTPILDGCTIFIYQGMEDLLRLDGASSSSPQRRRGGVDARSAIIAYEQVVELVRVLGGSVTRTLESPNLSVALYVGGALDLVGGDDAQPALSAPASGTALPASLSMAYEQAIHTMEHYRSHPTVDASQSPTTAPLHMVSTAWLVYSIMVQQHAEIRPFILAGGAFDVLRSQLASRSSRGSRSPNVATTSSATTTPSPSGKAANRSPSLYAAKTRASPSSAKKDAAKQWNTQEIELALHPRTTAKASPHLTNTTG